MSFWSSFTGSIRNFGNRIARIFTRKKDRHIESSKAVNEQNQKATIDSKKVATPNSSTDSKYIINPLNETPVTEERFQRCTSYSPKTKNHLQHQNANSTHSLEEISDHKTHLDETKAQMERPKDINQLYREMEEAVAQKVRETMELADSRRRALAESAHNTIERQITPNIKQVEDKTPEVDIYSYGVTYRTDNEINEDKDAARAIEIVADDDDHLKIEEIQQEFEDINRSIREEQAKMYRVEIDDKGKDEESTVEETKQINSDNEENRERDSLDNLTKTDIATNAYNMVEDNVIVEYPDESDDSVKETLLETAPSSDDQNSQIGFEYFENLSINDPRNQWPQDTNEFDIKHELAQIPSNPTQNPERVHTENIFEDFGDNIRTTEFVQTLKNNPFDITEDSDAELRRMGEDALILAETAARNYSTNPFESSDDEIEIRLGDGTISMVQNDWRNQTKNPFGTIDEEALTFEQNSSKRYVTNPFDMLDEEELRQIGVDALNIAQTGARNVDDAKRQLSENAEDLDNAFNSLIDSADLQNPIIQIGFDHFDERMDRDHNTANINILNENQAKK